MLNIKLNLSSTRAYKRQILATLTANLIALCTGVVLGWLSPTLLILQSPDTPLKNGPLTVEEVSWLGALYLVGGVVGCISTGALADALGRKTALYLIAFPQLAFWLLVLFGDHIYYLFTARFLGGIGGGGSLVAVPLFITEIADKDIRGALGSILAVCINLGSLIGYILGAKLSYRLFPSVITVLPIAFFILMCLFPETPQYLLSRNKPERAKKSLAFYQNVKSEPTKEESAEFETLFTLIQDRVSNSKLGQKLQLSDFYTPEARKGMILSICICIGYMFCGIFVLMQHTANIFKETKVSLDPNTSAIIIGVGLVIGTLVSVALVDHLGRKPLFIGSYTFTALGFLLTGIHVLLTNRFNVALWDWVPVATLFLSIFSASAGLFPITFIIMAELLPSQIRPVGSSICTAIFNIAGFIVLYIYPILVLEIYLYGVMFLYAISSFLGLLFVIICIPETKGQFL